MKTDSLIIFILAMVMSVAFSVQVEAQEVVRDGYHLVDSVIYRPAATVDSSYVGRDVFRVMPSKARGGAADVNISQSSKVSSSMSSHVKANAQRTIAGYRVRIFFDNKQTARAESEAALKRFESLYHDVVAYRSYANPYFKVTVGDFRTKSEAMELLERIKYEFPSAFVVKENINYPVVDKNKSYITDTIKVMRPISAKQ